MDIAVAAFHDNQLLLVQVELGKVSLKVVRVARIRLRRFLRCQNHSDIKYRTVGLQVKKLTSKRMSGCAEFTGRKVFTIKDVLGSGCTMSMMYRCKGCAVCRYSDVKGVQGVHVYRC